jgi:hypothetical protein
LLSKRDFNRLQTFKGYPLQRRRDVDDDFCRPVDEVRDQQAVDLFSAMRRIEKVVLLRASSDGAHWGCQGKRDASSRRTLTHPSS